jgi:hypothetical protein
MATEEQQIIWERVRDRVQWWVTDMAFKPPEVLTEHYYNCMAEDIADFAGSEDVGELSAMDRLDPPPPPRPKVDKPPGTEMRGI